MLTVSLAVVVEVVYVCGGSDGRTLKTMEALNLTTGLWKRLESMQYKREDHGFTSGPDGKLYAIGGYSGSRCLGKAERYDQRTNAWEEIRPLQHSRRSFGAVSVPDGVYVFGGYDGARCLTSVERYSVGNKEWTAVRCLARPKCSVACVAAPDCRSVYVLGGCDEEALDSAEKYDAITNEWHVITPMKFKRFMHAAVVASN